MAPKAVIAHAVCRIDPLTILRGGDDDDNSYSRNEEEEYEWVRRKNPNCHGIPCGVHLRAPNPQAPWTTARCNRLIRPLISKLTILRKIKQLGSRELKTSQRDSAGVPAHQTVRRPKHVFSREAVENGRREIASSHTSESQSSMRFWIAKRIVSSVDSPDSSSTDEETTDPWSDVLGEERVRKRLKSTYSTKRNTRTLTDTSKSVYEYEGLRGGGYLQLREDALALSRQGVPSQPLLDQQGNLKDFQGDAAHKTINPDSILPGNYRTCSKEISREFRDLAKALLPVNWRLLDSIYDHLDALLRATSLEPDPSNGPRSLLTMCLRQITNGVKEEELRISEEDPDDKSDVATRIFSDVEAQNTTSKAGWEPLKDMVRAHGLRLLAESVKESLISLPLARGLVILCLHRQAYDEARVIIESMLQTMKPLSKPTSVKDKLFAFGHSIALHTMILLHGSAGSENLAFTYKQLTMLFRSGIIPIEWVACRDMVNLWNGVVGSITQGAANAAEAASLFQAIVSQMYGDLCGLDDYIELLRTGEGLATSSSGYHIPAPSKGRGASSDNAESSELRPRAAKTINNMLTVMSAIEILQKPHWTVVHNVGIEAQKAQELAFLTPTRQDAPVFERTQMGLTILAANLVQTQLDVESQTFTKAKFVRLDAHYAENPEFLEPAGSLVCNVARCCGKAVAQDPFQHLRQLLAGLNSVSSRLDRVARKLYNGISLAAAFAFAEETGQYEHLEWASALELKACGMIPGPSLRTPHKTLSNGHKAKTDGYRWEEGICEWVARTPVGSLNTLKQDGLRDVADNERVGRLDGATHASRPEPHADLPDLSPCLKKRKRGSQENVQGSHERRKGQRTAAGGDSAIDNESSTDEVSQRNHASSEIEDLYSVGADELLSSSQQTARTSLEPKTTESSRANRQYKHPSVRPQRKRAETTGQLSGTTSIVSGDFQPAEESEDELSFA